MSQEDDKADVVDFDALHAALGDIPPPPTSSTPVVSEAQSSGKNNATYASARPHTIPPTRAPVVDMNAPSIVIADEVQSRPNIPVAHNQMTIPMGSPMLSGVGAVSPGAMPVARPPSPSHPGYDAPRFPANEAVQQTMHMAGRPVPLPRRPRSPTMVVRPRGPSSKQKVLVFLAMLFLVVGLGIAALAVLRPGALGIEGIPGMKTATPPPPPPPTIRKATTAAPTPVLTVAPTPVVTTAPAATTAPTPSVAPAPAATPTD